MALDKNDLKAIEKIVSATENRLEQKILATENRLEQKIVWSEDRLNTKVGNLGVSLNKKISETENRILATMAREITDLAETNRAVIEKIDKIAEFEKRLTKVETKLGF